jgi:hypothetical protein
MSEKVTVTDVQANLKKAISLQNSRYPNFCFLCNKNEIFDLHFDGCFKMLILNSKRFKPCKKCGFFYVDDISPIHSCYSIDVDQDASSHQVKIIDSSELDGDKNSFLASASQPKKLKIDDIYPLYQPPIMITTRLNPELDFNCVFYKYIYHLFEIKELRLEIDKKQKKLFMHHKCKPKRNIGFFINYLKAKLNSYHAIFDNLNSSKSYFSMGLQTSISRYRQVTKESEHYILFIQRLPILKDTDNLLTKYIAAKFQEKGLYFRSGQYFYNNEKQRQQYSLEPLKYYLLNELKEISKIYN